MRAGKKQCRPIPGDDSNTTRHAPRVPMMGIAYLLATVHSAMMYVPIDAGFCTSRWKHAVDVMLGKNGQDRTS
jgi:hypothetical protein